MPKIVDHDAERARIADAAIRAIGESGLDQVRLVDVARAARATTGAITHYFDGKDALLTAALERVAERLIAAVDRLRPGKLIDDAGRALPLDDLERRDWRVWLAFWGRAISNRELAEVHNRYYARLHARLAEAIRAAQARGEIAAAIDAATAADAVITAVDGLGVRASLDPDGWPARRQRALLRKILEPLLAAPRPQAMSQERKKP